MLIYHCLTNPWTRAGQHLVSLVVVGEADSPAFHRQAEEYGDSLEGAGMRVVRSTVPREDHFRWWWWRGGR